MEERFTCLPDFMAYTLSSVLYSSLLFETGICSATSLSLTTSASRGGHDTDTSLMLFGFFYTYVYIGEVIKTRLNKKAPLR